ncbi:MAG: hypothetical protein ACRCR9_06770 [Chitinophagaceae bacterium]
MYFIDADSGGKNKKYYTEELEKMSVSYHAQIKIFYGKALFAYLDFIDIWTEILAYLEKWKIEIPDFPEINFDIDAQETFNEIVLTLFPQQKTLRLLLEYFSTKHEAIYQTLAKTLKEKLI